MSAEGMFQKVYRTVSQHPSVSRTANEWAELDNNYSRVQFLLNNAELETLLSPRSRRTSKDLNRAKSLKDEGNKYFQTKNHAAALSAYNKALLLTPFKDNEGLLSVCYSNRSAVLFHMKSYAKCLNDIIRAQDVGYPKESLYKLLVRKAKCHQFLDSHLLSDAVKSAAESLNISSLDDRGKNLWQNELSKVSMRLTDAEPSLGNGLPTSLENPGKQYPALTETVKVSENNEFGHYIQAESDISAGEVILVEAPYCSVTLPDYWLTHCCHCQVRVDITPLPCPECADVVYCSSECQKLSWNNYHRFECCHIRNLRDVNVNMGHLALRTALQAGLSTLFSLVQNGITAENAAYLSNEYSNVFHLEGHESERAPSDLFWRTVASTLLSGMCDIRQWGGENKDARMMLASVTLHHLQVFPCNAHEISDMLYNKRAPCKSEQLAVGAGIYATLSFFNHSCDPTVVRLFTSGNTCVVKTLCPVNSNEQIFDNYGCLYAVHPVEERIAKLSSQYYFQCCCEPCLQDWGLYSSLSYEAEPIYKCAACSSLIVDDECQKCDFKFNKDATTNSLVTAQLAFNQVLCKLFTEHIEGVELTQTLSKLIAYSNLINKLVFRPYRTLNDCQEALKHVYNMTGNLSVKSN